jgi:OmpA-OmpF porin, OOP family
MTYLLPQYPRSGLLHVLVFTCGLGFAGTAHSADVENGKDHPLVGRYEGSEIVGYGIADYDEAVIIEAPFDPVGASERSGPGFKTIEGRIFLIYSRLPDGRSTLEVLRNYEQSLTAKGFSILFTCATGNGSCFASKQPAAAYYLGNAIGDPLTLPKLADDYVPNWFEQGGRYLLARLDRPEGAVYVNLSLGESNRGNVAVIRVVETTEMEAGKVVFLDASQMGQAIADSGRVALYGVLFDFDKDVVKPESKPTLDEIAKLLAAKPEVSRRRAVNVVAALTRVYGVAPRSAACGGRWPWSTCRQQQYRRGSGEEPSRRTYCGIV